MIPLSCKEDTSKETVEAFSAFQRDFESLVLAGHRHPYLGCFEALMQQHRQFIGFWGCEGPGS